MEAHQYPKPSRSYGPQVKMTIPPSQHSDNDRSSGELRALDCNLTSLCDHIQIEGFNSGAFSDVVVHAMGSAYHLHRLILSRSPYFRNMLHGPWKEANAPTVTLHVDDKNVNGEAIAMALAYLYGHHPKLNDNNAFRVLAAASFLDLQDLCAICTDFIISELWTSNFLAYQVFAESQDYGIHGERVRNACWGYLCQSGAMELKEVLPKLSSQTLHALLTSDELWVPSEEKRFELALYSFLTKCAHSKQENSEQESNSEAGMDSHSDSSSTKEKNLIDSFTDKRLESELGSLSLKDGMDGRNSARKLLVELADCVVDFQTGVSNSRKQVQQLAYPQSKLESGYPCNTGGSSLSNSFSDTNAIQTSCSYAEMPVGVGASGMGASGVALEGPSDEGSCFHLNNNSWLARDDYSRNCTSMTTSSNELMPSDWGRCGMPPFSWGGRIVGRRQQKGHANGNIGVQGEEYDSFVNIFEGGSLLYCNMSFEALLNVRKQLEELEFPCKAVNDGLWLQMLLSQRVQEIGADTCKSCCYVSMQCVCRQPFGFTHGVATSGYYMQEHDQNSSQSNMGNVYVAESAPGEGNGLFRPVRVHVRGPIDGLAGIGRGTTFVPAAAWPPTRFVFSRVPFGVGNRNYQQSLANDDSETRNEHNIDISGDGLTALVGLSQGGSNSANINGEPTERGYANINGEPTERGYEMDLQTGSSMTGPSSTSGIPVQMVQSSEHAIGTEWENTNSSSISLDMKTPLTHFPPFRFGVQFEDVHRLSDGQVKHSPDVFYAGSFWKVSVQAFYDEDPQGRRTLGLFLHRRKAEITDSLRKVHMYVDSREKVTARYQLICPSKREVMVFGSFKQAGTLLPKAPKGWGWRTALLFDELPDLLQNGALRIAAVVQLV
ncbi:Voltage dependent potassium channel [Trema orientale]|uniref:Voltage dependent potassium channel n=1 Tax=Trema orientale TaxID=63057 RepID=A0A2P5ES00_TREOI|nr:Voltage dependent potassium channel [Trema orientale]